MRRENIKEVVQIQKGFKPLISEGTVKPYIMERQVIRKFRNVNPDKLEDHQSTILTYSPKQLRYCLNLPDEKMVDEIINNNVPCKGLK